MSPYTTVTTQEDADSCRSVIKVVELSTLGFFSFSAFLSEIAIFIFFFLRSSFTCATFQADYNLQREVGVGRACTLFYKSEYFSVFCTDATFRSLSYVQFYR